jgi:hypothetical protein
MKQRLPISWSRRRTPETFRYRKRASADYASLKATVRMPFIPFEEAFSKVMGLVDGLPIPD